jgi:hypothetical protein
MDYMHWYTNNKKITIPLIILIILFLLLYMSLSQIKKQHELNSNTEYGTQQPMQNTENLQRTTRKKISTEKGITIVTDNISVIAIDDATIYSVYTYEQQDTFTNYLVVADFLSKDGAFVIKNYNNLDIDYKEFPISSELKELSKKQADITIQNNIETILNVK